MEDEKMNLSERISDLLGDPSERKPHLARGCVYKHPEDDRLVYITGGQFLSNGRISNFWYWQDVNEDGSLGEKGHGYGWCADPEPVEIRVIALKS